MTLADFSCPPYRSWSCEMDWVKQCLSLFAHTVISAVHWRSSRVCVLCHFQGRFNVLVKFASQLFCSSAHQTGLSSSIAPPCPPPLPQLIRLTEALYVWPCQLSKAFLQYHSQPNKVSVKQAARSALLNHHAKSAGIIRGNGPLVGNQGGELPEPFNPQYNSNWKEGK